MNAPTTPMPPWLARKLPRLLALIAARGTPSPQRDIVRSELARRLRDEAEVREKTAAGQGRLPLGVAE